MPDKDSNSSYTLEDIRHSLEAEIIVGEKINGVKVADIYASDLMSDVLAYGKSGSILLTGLNSIQAAISSYMAEFIGIIFIRGKMPGDDIRKYAHEKGMFVMSTKADMFEACAKVATTDDHHIQREEIVENKQAEENIISHDFDIDGHDFASAGMVSTQIKSILKSIGYNPQVIRRVAISTYEGEMNVVMHAVRAKVNLIASDREITVIIADEGKGIPDVKKAMQKGFSTATEEQRALGFGSGMGLPNIDKNSDKLYIESQVDQGTRLEIRFFVDKET